MMRVLKKCCVETYKWIRTLLWLIRFILLYLWKRVFRCKSRDVVFDEIAEKVEHKHPVETRTWGFGRKKEVRPKTFHQKAVRLDPVPIYYPKSLEEIRKIILKSPRFRAIGSGHSFRGVVETDGVLISLEDMNKILAVEGNVVTVQGGIKIRDAIRDLEKRGLALKNMGNYDRQSLAGAIVGGTHGTSGVGKTDTFTSSLVKLKMINAKGETVELGPEDSVNFGVGGIIYEVTLKLDDFYYLEQKSTTVEPAALNFNDWWTGSSQFVMCRWNFPGRDYEVCQVVKFRKVSVQEYERDRGTAFWDRFYRVFLFRASPFLPELIHRLAPRFFRDKSFVDKYYLQYVDDPAPHHTEWEYAVPYTSDLAGIIRGIPEAVRGIPYTVEVHIRNSPKDSATAHLASIGDVVWFDLNVVTPKGMPASELDELARPFEELMTAQGGVAHPHKLVVDIGRAGLRPQTIQYLTNFQRRHDPDKKMVNPALARMLNQPLPAPLGSPPNEQTPLNP